MKDQGAAYSSIRQQVKKLKSHMCVNPKPHCTEDEKKASLKTKGDLLWKEGHGNLWVVFFSSPPPYF